MDSTSGSMKRGSDQGSLPSPSLVRPRTESAPPYQEPLSHYPEDGASQRSPNSVLPYSISLEVSRPPRREARMSIDMSMQDYQHIMHTLASELQAARGLGREEGVRAMDVVVQQLTDLIDRMYKDGQGLQQRRNAQEAALLTEREQAKAWMEQTQKDLQQQSEAWALERKAEFERMFKQEQAELIARSQREQDTM